MEIVMSIGESGNIPAGPTKTHKNVPQIKCHYPQGKLTTSVGLPTTVSEPWNVLRALIVPSGHFQCFKICHDTKYVLLVVIFQTRYYEVKYVILVSDSCPIDLKIGVRTVDNG